MNYTLEPLTHTHFYAVCALPQMNRPTTLTQLTPTLNTVNTKKNDSDTK